MDKETSAYLDCVRFLAALAVMICHINGDFFSDAFPFFSHFGLEAVGVFFVLSGFVIGYVTDTKEKTLKTYAINRMARVYSVVIPCLIFTFFFDAISRHFHPALYSSATHEALEILLSLGFLDPSWLVGNPIMPGSNGPYWSLFYEIPYYAIFGAFYFLRGRQRWISTIAILGCVGPYVIAMFPCWLAGLGIYRLCRNLHLNRRAGWLIFMGSMLVWVIAELILWRIGASAGIRANVSFAPIIMYLTSVWFALSILGFRFTGIRIRQFTGFIIWLAGGSFTLYLFHLPFMLCLNTLLPISTPNRWRWLILLFTTLGAALIVAHFTERRKHYWRIAIEKVAAKFEARKAVSS